MPNYVVRASVRFLLVKEGSKDLRERCEFSQFVSAEPACTGLAEQSTKRLNSYRDVTWSTRARRLWLSTRIHIPTHAHLHHPACSTKLVTQGGPRCSSKHEAHMTV
jgi:hypothetical protein